MGPDNYAIDFQLSTGDPVAAAAAGLAHIGSFQKNGYGNFVWIQHDNGTTNDDGGVISIYAHLSQIKISDGQHVSQGQIIGLAGSSGNVTGPHLHFAMRTGATSPSFVNSTGGLAYKPEPMSGYAGFGAYGQCGSGQNSPDFTA
jgi:murein DD-endopeptidase MepM/ murein hydrolase activator NlpD